MSNKKKIKAILSGCLSVKVRGEDIDLTPPEFEDVVAISESIQKSEGDVNMLEQAAACVRAVLPDDDLSDREIAALIALSGGMMGDLALAAFDLCGIPLRDTIDENRDETVF